eukprot:TRINITY_DN40475_c0_g1_i1.p1 TRINITY_DN40475_c0_g1~~TRINITY_DN40475_c0_g1_i1.p1  ORF type:complete len:492 (+),score=65.46 TRINITY_DN40475_c0_g1_i1:88-1563(+)
MPLSQRNAAIGCFVASVCGLVLLAKPKPRMRTPAPVRVESSVSALDDEEADPETPVPAPVAQRVNRTSSAPRQPRVIHRWAGPYGPSGRPRGNDVLFYSYGPPRDEAEVGSVLLLSASESPGGRGLADWLPQRTCAGCGMTDAELVLRNRHCYASAHGYDFAIDLTPRVSGLRMPLCGAAGMCQDAPEKQPKKRKLTEVMCPSGGCTGPLPAHWVKVAALKVWTPLYDWVLWMDTDSFFTSVQKPVSDLVRSMGDNAHLLVPQDEPGVTYVFSNFAFLLRNSDVGRKLLRIWWDDGTRPGCRYWKSPFEHGINVDIDNFWMWHAIMNIRWPSGTPTNCADPCKANLSMRRCMADTYRNVSRKLFGSMYGLRNRSPGAVMRNAWDRRGEDLVVFGDAAEFGLQANWGRGRKARARGYVRAFLTHVKPINSFFKDKGGVKECVVDLCHQKRCSGSDRNVRCGRPPPGKGFDEWAAQWGNEVSACSAQAPTART